MCGEAFLIAVTIAPDSIGNQIEQETRRLILTFEKSITRSEWHDAGRRGLNPALCLVTPRCNYNGERIIEYNHKRYAIYRTFEVDEKVELYLEQKAPEDWEWDPFNFDNGVIRKTRKGSEQA